MLAELLNQDPFRSLDQILAGGARSSAATPPLDAYRRGDNVWVHVDLPGVSADSIDIDIERSVLTITAERNYQTVDGDQVYLAERPQGRLRRQIHLGEGLDTAGVEAGYTDGVLSLRIPVAERAKPRKVKVANELTGSAAHEVLEASVEA